MLRLMAPAAALPKRSLLVTSYVAVCILWGSTYLGIRIALEDYPPFFIGAARFLAAGLFLLGVARVRGEPMPKLAEWGGALLTGTLFFVLGNGLLNVAEKSVSSSLASVLVATMPLWATVFARFFGERVTRWEVVGVVLGLAGVFVMNLGGELRASPAGAALALFAPMSWALGSLASKKVPAPAGIMRTAAQMSAGGAVMLLLSRALGEQPALAASARGVAAVAYLCVFGSIVGFSAFTYLLKHTRPVVATSYAYVNPVIAVALGVLFAGEHVGAASAIGAVIVMGAVIMVGLARSRKAPAAAPSVAGERPPAGASLRA